jgi:hypothetical protein
MLDHNQHYTERDYQMPKDNKRQALALTARLSSQALPGHTAGAIASLEAEAARVMREATAAANGSASAHLVVEAGRLSGYVQDGHTTVRFGGGNVAVTSHA